MKKIFIKSILALSLLTFFTSCEDEQDLSIVSPPTVQFTTISPENGTSIVLDKDHENNPALTASWNPAMFEGTQTVVTYAIQIDKDGNDFANAYTFAGSSSRSQTITVKDLNTAAQLVGLSVNAAGTLNVRIKATVGTTGSLPSYSNVLNYTVTPYLSYLFKDLFLVGAATAPGWNPNNDNPALWRDPANKDLYEFTGYFIGGGGDGAKFKLIETLGLWQPQWGTNGGTAIAGNPGTQSSDPGEFQNTSPSGYYTLKVNMKSTSLSYTFEPYAGSTTTTYSVVGLIGDAVGGWGDSNQVALTQSTFDSHLWFKRNVALANGPVKFRANNGWSVNWGSDTAYSGTGTQDGPNIPISGTNYDVWFCDLTGKYMFIPVQ